MDLHIATPDINYPILRLESDSGEWEMGIYPTLYGTRVSCGRIGSHTYLKGGYCCGRSPVLLMETTICIAAILSSFPESATMREVDSVLPEWNLRPIDLDDGLDKLRETFANRCGEMQQGEPLVNAKSILDALTEVCENLMNSGEKT